MRLPVYLLAVGGGTLLQGNLVPALPPWGVVPDVPLILVVLLSLRRGSEAGCLAGFALGLAQDVLGGGPLGLHVVSKAVLGFLAGDLPRVFLVERPVVVGVAVALLTVADGTLRFGLLQLFHYPAPFGELLASVVLPQASYDGAVALAVSAVPALRTRLS